MMEATTRIELVYTVLQFSQAHPDQRQPIPFGLDLSEQSDAEGLPNVCLSQLVPSSWVAKPLDLPFAWLSECPLSSPVAMNKRPGGEAGPFFQSQSVQWIRPPIRDGCEDRRATGVRGRSANSEEW